MDRVNFMRLFSRYQGPLIATVLVSATLPAWADGDNTFRFGEYFIHYQANVADVTGTGVGAVPPGTQASVDAVNTLYLAYIRRLTSHFDLEMAMGIPPGTTLVGKGPTKLGSVPYAGQNIASSKWLSPTVLLNYNFFAETATWRPYVGIGINYTHFYDNTASAAGNAAFGGPTTATLADSWGWAGTVGLKYRYDAAWSLYASYSVSQVRSNMTANTAGALRTTSIDFHPSALVLSAGYSF